MSEKIDLSKYSVLGFDKKDEFRLHKNGIIYSYELKSIEDIIEKLKEDGIVFKLELKSPTKTLEYYIADEIEYKDVNSLSDTPVIRPTIPVMGLATNFKTQKLSHRLDKSDIVLNRELKKIYPKNTGKIPAKLIKFLAQNTK